GDGDNEPIAGAQDLALQTRSRGAGVFGLTYRSDLLDEDTANLLTLQIAEYKTYRDIVAQANASLLTLQVPYDMSGWDALQEISEDSAIAIVFAFEGEMCEDRITVRPRGLLAEATYDVLSLDGGSLGAARGSELMQDGIEVVRGAASRAHVLLLRARF